MIQRIQSLFLLIAVMLLFVLYWFPIASFQLDGLNFHLFVCHFQHPESGAKLISMLPLSALPALSAILSFVAIFRYKNRTNQMMLSKLVILLLSATLVIEAIYFVRIGKMLGVEGEPAFSAIIPLVAMLFLFMAHRGIKKDDKLVKSADRIR